ncbi:sodium:solute symporter family transporter [Streptomyces solicathayae]|uniref:Transporter n=1 Tax=Streptomyces solicathayae TaxID=3081768 RepID=A0ABZ0LQ91_9ACTN|nr:transporter [Streptomyces sp. HUAS YS2]WOX21616.1 transporter [Streptomyces sp. HUAS YS2]
MTLHVLSSAQVDPIGSDARGPVIVAFLVFIGLSLLWVFNVVTQEDHPERLYIADRSLSPVFNGFAMAGEQISAVTLLAIPGAITLFGYDGFGYAVDILITLGVTMLMSQKVRNSGRYTLGDLFSLRASGTAPRIAAAIVTLTIAIPLLLIQLRAAGISTALVIGMSTDEAQVVCTVLMGCLVACFAAVADLRGTSLLHVVKVPITLVTLAVLTLLALGKFAWDPGSLLSAAVNNSVAPDAYLSPGLWPYTEGLGPLNSFGDHMVLILGTAVAPHLLLRVSASRNGRSARRSVSIAVGLVGVFALLLITTGFAAAAVVGSKVIGAVDGNGQSSPILLASGVLGDGSTGRVALITAMACVVFLAVLSTTTSVAFAAAVSFAHDVFGRSKHSRTDTGEVLVLRLAVVVLCVVGLSLSAATHRYPVDFLVTFSMSVAASCVFPPLVYSFFWRSFNHKGLLWSVYGGLLLCTVLMFFSPSVSGTEYALWPEASFDWFPFQTPGLIAVPAAFFLGWLGSIISPDDAEPEFPAIEYRLLTGKEVEQGR